jgi:hypothetical protein
VRCSCAFACIFRASFQRAVMRYATSLFCRVGGGFAG